MNMCLLVRNSTEYFSKDLCNVKASKYSVYKAFTADKINDLRRHTHFKQKMSENDNE